MAAMASRIVSHSVSMGELLREPEQRDRRDRLHQYDAIQDQIRKAEDAAKMRGH